MIDGVRGGEDTVRLDVQELDSDEAARVQINSVNTILTEVTLFTAITRLTEVVSTRLNTEKKSG